MAKAHSDAAERINMNSEGVFTAASRQEMKNGSFLEAFSLS